MAKIIFSTRPEMPIFFNIDANVGERCPNRSEDVAVASYMMRAAGKMATNPEAKRVCLNTKVTNSCTPELIKSIKDLQAALKMTVDGHISVSNASGSYGQDSAYLIARLNFLVKAGAKDVWPRIDRITEIPTPAELNAVIKRQLIGTDG